MYIILLKETLELHKENEEVCKYSTLEEAIIMTQRNNLTSVLIINLQTSFVLNVNISYYEDLVDKATILLSYLSDEDKLKNLEHAKELALSVTDLNKTFEISKILFALIIYIAGNDYDIKSIANVINQKLEENQTAVLKNQT